MFSLYKHSNSFSFSLPAQRVAVILVVIRALASYSRLLLFWDFICWLFYLFHGA